MSEEAEFGLQYQSDPRSNAGGQAEVDLQIAGDGLYIFDRGGKRLHFWPYAEIVDAIAANDEMVHVMARRTRRDITFTAGSDAHCGLVASLLG